MKQWAFCVLAAALLVACADDTGTADGEATSPTAEPGAMSAPAPAPVAEPVPAPEDQKGIDALAEAGVELDFPHAINYDILDTSKNGTPRHRVLVEVLGGDFDATVQQFTDGLLAKGYSMASGSGTGGRFEQVYVQDGKPTYYLLMQAADVGPPLGNPDATGSIHIMWNRN